LKFDIREEFTASQIHNSTNPILILTGFTPASLQVVHVNRNMVQSNNDK